MKNQNSNSQRRIKQWRATEGPSKEVYFDQVFAVIRALARIFLDPLGSRNDHGLQ